VLDTATNTVTETVPVDSAPFGVAITPDGSRAYISTDSYFGGKVLVIAIDRAPALTGTPAAGIVGQPYRHAFTVTGQPAPTAAVTAGALPGGLDLSPAGVLSGTPTAVGTSTFTITATNEFGTATHTVTLTVAAAPAAPTFTDAGPAQLNGIAGTGFTHTFAVAGNPAPTVAVTAGTLPDGLTLSPDGVLSGTPTAAGASTFTITASNGVGNPATLDVTVTVAPASAAPMFTDAGPVSLNTVAGKALSREFTVTGNPAPTISVLDASTLPPGMSFTDGTLSGTPTTAGTYTFTVVASNGVGPDLTLDVTVVVTAGSVTPEPSVTGSLGSLGSAPWTS